MIDKNEIIILGSFLSLCSVCIYQSYYIERLRDENKRLELITKETFLLAVKYNSIRISLEKKIDQINKKEMN